MDNTILARPLHTIQKIIKNQQITLFPCAVSDTYTHGNTHTSKDVRHSPLPSPTEQAYLPFLNGCMLATENGREQ